MATVKDVARAAGVSPSTVSAVLNGKASVHPKTVERVRAAIATTGYKRNYAARGLRMRQSNLVGLIVPDISNRHFALLAKAVSEACSTSGFMTMVADSANDREREMGMVGKLLEQQVAGLLHVPSTSDQDFGQFVANAVPVPHVLVENNLRGLKRPFFSLNNYEMGGDAIRHLSELGHTDIAIVTGQSGASSISTRERACREVAAELGHPVADEWIVDGGFDRNTAVEKLLRLMTARRRPTAVVCLNNMMTVGAIEVFQRLGIRCPQEVSLLGFDRFEASDLLQPAVSLFEHDKSMADIGVAAANCLTEMIGGGTVTGDVHSEFKSRFRDRDSTAAPPVN